MLRIPRFKALLHPGPVDAATPWIQHTDSEIGDCQQHSQLEQQLSTPACPSAQASEQYIFPSFSTADWGATVQLQGSQAQAWLFIAMGFLVTESFISLDGPHRDPLIRGSLRSARLSSTQVQAPSRSCGISFAVRGEKEDQQFRSESEMGLRGIQAQASTTMDEMMGKAAISST